MKQRVISAVVALAICIYPLIYGGITLKLLVAFIALVGCYEFSNVSMGKADPVQMFLMLAFIGTNTLLYEKTLGVSLIYLIVLFSLSVFSEKYPYPLICETYALSLIIAHAIVFLAELYDTGRSLLLLYILIAAFGADIFAYFGGMFCKKAGVRTHKFNERVSPKKTTEGAVIGWIAGAALSFAFASYFNWFDLGVTSVLLLSVLLPPVSQVGDLSFSLIKRHFGVKDFGNIMPGHGGVLDRLDSALFCIIFLRAMLIIL